MYRCTLVTTDSSGKITTKTLGDFRDKKKAMAQAKKGAGRGAKFVAKGEDFGYYGPNGFVWVT